jgi:hypothetical protein
MDIRFNCPRCGQHLCVEESGAGITVNCPKCNEKIEIPRSTAPPPAIPIPATAQVPQAVKRANYAVPVIVLGITFCAVAVIIAVNQLRDANVTAPASEPMATSGIETLSPITVKLKDEILNALKMTDKLDALYQRGCSSAEFIAAATPIESVFINLDKKLPKGDPGRDLFANVLEAYQQTAVAIKAYEQGRGQRPDALVGAAELRKGLLVDVLQGNMTANEKEVYKVWLQGHP